MLLRTLKLIEVGHSNMSSWESLVLLAILAMVGIALQCGPPLLGRLLAKWKLWRVIAEIERTEPQWQWDDVQARRAVVPPERNGADLLLEARRLIPETDVKLPLEQTLWVLPPKGQLEPAVIQQLRAERARLAAALDVARRLQDFPDGRFAIAYTCDSASTNWDDLLKSRVVSDLLWLDAVLRAEDGEPDNALASCCSIVNAARSVGDEPILVPQLLRAVCHSIAIQCMERVLAQGQPSDTALMRAQRLLELELTVPQLLLAAQGERAFIHRTMEAFTRGDLTLVPFLKWQPNEKAQVIAAELLDRATCFKVHAGILRLYTDLVGMAKRPMPEWVSLTEQFEKHLDKSLLTIRNEFTNEFVNVSAAPKTLLRNQALLNCAVTALAVERYRHRHGHWPQTLAALQPEFLAEVLADPYNGQPLRYRPHADSVVIYSIGLQGIDHGGSINRTVPFPPDANFGFRLWDVPYRGSGAPGSNAVEMSDKS